VGGGSGGEGGGVVDVGAGTEDGVFYSFSGGRKGWGGVGGARRQDGWEGWEGGVWGMGRDWGRWRWGRMSGERGGGIRYGRREGGFGCISVGEMEGSENRKEKLTLENPRGLI